MNGKLGSLAQPIYFINQSDPNYPVGYYILAPYSDFPNPHGWCRFAAETLSEVDRLQKILLSQEIERARREHIREEWVMAPLRQKVRDRLYATMTSTSTPLWERHFISEYLKLRIDKRQRHADNHYHRNLYLHARENDARPGRKPNEEKFDTKSLELVLG